jgi:hypothetical protein
MLGVAVIVHKSKGSFVVSAKTNIGVPRIILIVSCLTIVPLKLDVNKSFADTSVGAEDETLNDNGVVRVALVLDCMESNCAEPAVTVK